MQKICKNCQQNFEIVSEDLKFYNKISPVFEGKKYLIPAPSLCSECRQQRRLSFRNERNLYNRKCDLCKKDIISMYSFDKEYIVYCQSCWWSDKWDPLNYGQEYDFNRSFFEQFYNLSKKVPQISLFNTKSENSDFCNLTTFSKNCYLCFGGDYNFDCFHCTFNFNTKNCIDVYWLNKSELCYQCVDCDTCFHVKYSQYAKNCSDSSFLFDCQNCENCIACIGLNNKKFYIFNKHYSKDEYESVLHNLNLNSY